MWEAYFDESGQHDAADNRLVKLSIGGCVASFESWQRFSRRWSRALAEMSLPCFHMVDFEPAV
jgi:hypothetical protein